MHGHSQVVNFTFLCMSVTDPEKQPHVDVADIDSVQVGEFT